MTINLESFYKVLINNQIDFFTGVPDSLLKSICNYISDYSPEGRHVITANEGASIALATGYNLATNKIPLVYMQNSGLGNAINPLTSLADKKVYNIPMLLMIGWRGEPFVPDEPQHVKQGEITEDLLKCLDIPFLIIGPDEDKKLPNLIRALNVVNSRRGPVALLVRKDTFESYSKLNNHTINPLLLTREEAIKSLLEVSPKGSFYVSTTGMASRELYEIRDINKDSHSFDLLTVGSMGHSSSIALGLAKAKNKKRSVCLDGDGAVLMHLGSMAIIGTEEPENFVHIVLNNGAHDSVGGQPSVAQKISLPSIAKACNYKNIYSVSSKEEINSLKESISSEKGPIFIELIIKKGSRKDLGRPKTTPLANKESFMEQLKL